MKFCVVLLQVISIFAIFGPTWGDHADVDCTETKSLHVVLFDSLDKCFGKIGGLDPEELKSISSFHLPSEPITEYCERQELIKNCLSTISTNSSACHNETQREEFLFLEDVLKIGLSYSCVEHGDLLGHIIFEVLHEENSTPERNAATDCIDAAKSTPVEDSTTLNTATGFLRLYRDVKNFKDCLVDRLRGLNRGVFGVELILNRILRSMKCHHPDDGTTVLCNTLNTSPLTDKVCLFKGGDQSEKPQLAKFVDYASECVRVNVNQLHFQTLPDFTTLEEYQSFMNTYCQNRLHNLNCLGDVLSNSKVCPNETLQKAVQTIVNFVEHTVETGCKDDGVNLAMIFNGIFNHKGGAVSNETFRGCLRTGQDMKRSGSNDDNDSTAHEIVLVYRIVDAIKQCILDGASEEGTFKSVFGTFMNEILTAAKCINPEDETVVPCATLINN